MLIFREGLREGKRLIKRIASNKSKGEINYWLGIGIVAAVLILVGYPQIKSIFTSVWGTISTWFTANMAKIFTNLP